MGKQAAERGRSRGPTPSLPGFSFTLEEVLFWAGQKLAAQRSPWPAVLRLEAQREREEAK